MGKYRGPSNQKQRGHRITRLMARDGDCCTICGRRLDRHLRDHRSPEYITFDHKVPRSRGGLSMLDNLRLAHQACNNRRGNDPLPEPELGVDFGMLPSADGRLWREKD